MPSKMKRPWTLAQIEEVRKLAKQGKLAVEIADALGRSYESVKGVAQRHGITIKQSRP
jgi:DNA-binding CsgD family transcriptional regulator